MQDVTPHDSSPTVMITRAAARAALVAVGLLAAVWGSVLLIAPRFGGMDMPDYVSASFAAPLAGAFVAFGLALAEQWVARGESSRAWALARVVGASLVLVVLGELIFEAQRSYAVSVLIQGGGAAAGLGDAWSAAQSTAGLWVDAPSFGLPWLAFDWAAVVAVTAARALGWRLRSQVVTGLVVVVGCYMLFQGLRGVNFVGIALATEGHVFARALVFPCAAAAAGALARRVGAEAAPELGSASGRLALS